MSIEKIEGISFRIPLKLVSRWVANGTRDLEAPSKAREGKISLPRVMGIGAKVSEEKLMRYRLDW